MSDQKFDPEISKQLPLYDIANDKLTLGEKLEREEVDILIKECCDPEDDDGFIPYERKPLVLL